MTEDRARGLGCRMETGQIRLNSNHHTELKVKRLG